MNKTKRLCFLALVATLLVATSGAKNQYLICKSVDDVFGDTIIKSERSDVQKTTRPMETEKKGVGNLETERNLQKGSENSEKLPNMAFEVPVWNKRLIATLPEAANPPPKIEKDPEENVEEKTDVAPPIENPVDEEKPKLDPFQFAKDMLKRHNKYRADHATDPMTLNVKLCEEAQTWADSLASIGELVHESQMGRRGAGENLARDSNDLTADKAVDMWYNESVNYDFSTPPSVGLTGHFSQVIWKGSKEFGAGVARRVDGSTFVVGRYLPAGNMMGQFKENVLPKP